MEKYTPSSIPPCLRKENKQLRFSSLLRFSSAAAPGEWERDFIIFSKLELRLCSSLARSCFSDDAQLAPRTKNQKKRKIFALFSSLRPPCAQHRRLLLFLRQLVVVFLPPKDPIIRPHILSLLAGYFITNINVATHESSVSVQKRKRKNSPEKKRAVWSEKNLINKTRQRNDNRTMTTTATTSS